MEINQSSIGENTQRGLYRVAGIAALLAALLFRRNLSAEISLISPIPIPQQAADWFTLLHTHPLLGLAYLNVFDLVEYILVGLMFLALYEVLKPVNRTGSLIALCMGLLAVSLNFTSNQAFSMLSLSQQAITGVQPQAAALTMAGEALLAIANHGTAVYAGLLFISLAGLIFSSIMLNSGHFSRLTGNLGITANAIMLTHFVVLPLAPDWTVLPFVLSAPLRVAWYILVGLRLIKTTSR